MKKFISLFILIFMFSSVNQAQVIIKNSEKPLSQEAGRIVHLTEVMRITDDHGGYYFKYPFRIKISPDAAIFVEDEDQLLKFDKSGKFLGNFFRKGQGPDELLFISDYIFKDNNLVIHDRPLDKILVMDQNGKTLRGLKIRVPGSKNFLTIYNDNYYFFKSDPPDTMGALKILKVNNNLISVSSDGEAMEKKYAFPMIYMIIKAGERSFISGRSKLLSCPKNDETFFISNTNEYEIKIFSLERNEIIRQFNRSYKRVKVTDETRKYAYGGNYGRVSIGYGWFEVPVAEYHDDVQMLLMVKDKLWAFTSTVDKKKGVLVDVFDENGRYIDNFYLKYPENVIPYNVSLWIKAIFDNFIYTVEQDEEGNYAILKNRIEDT